MLDFYVVLPVQIMKALDPIYEWTSSSIQCSRPQWIRTGLRARLSDGPSGQLAGTPMLGVLTNHWNNAKYGVI